MATRRPVLLLYFALMSLFGATGACPEPCVCKWKNGKQTVECSDRDLLVIPIGMDSGTQVLEFSGNNLQTLHDETFLKLGLSNLQRIHVSRCNINKIEDAAFNGLTNLVELDLSGNSLEDVPSAAFQHTPALMRLILSNNPITVIKQAAFHPLSYLSTIELNNCEISKLEDGSFQSLHSLEWLHLEGNKLTNLNGRVFESLRGIELQHNPWVCDCHMLQMSSWLRAFTGSMTVEPACQEPAKLAGRLIQSIPALDLACLPDVSPTTFYLEIGEGKNVSLLCHVRSIPGAQVSWWFQGQLLQNDTLVAPGTRLIYYVEEGDGQQKRSELFINSANSEDNGTFVCSAENPAGIVHANFTIRVVLREEPTREVPPSIELVVVTTTVAAVSMVVLVCVSILVMLRCRNTNRRAHRKQKEVLIRDSAEDSSTTSKSESNANLAECRKVVCYSVHKHEDLKRAVSGTSKTSTPVLSRYQDQNPDLINDTESVGRRKDGDGECLVNLSEIRECGRMKPNPAVLPRPGELYALSADVHLNPVGLLNAGDNRMCYRTLPYSKTTKRHCAANPKSRYVRETEFLARTHPEPYERYGTDVRYTADGYPVRALHQETVIAEGSSRSCCSMSPVSPLARKTTAPREASGAGSAGGKRCVGAQTETVGAQTQTDLGEIAVSLQRPGNKSVCALVRPNDLSESPDEGYEGESLETNSNPC